MLQMETRVLILPQENLRFKGVRMRCRHSARAKDCGRKRSLTNIKYLQITLSQMLFNNMKNTLFY